MANRSKTKTTPQTLFVCSLCFFEAPTETAFTNHLSFKHGRDLFFWCKWCGVLFSDRPKYVQHLSKDECTKNYQYNHPCGFDKCEYSTGNPTRFLTHFTKNHKGEPFLPCAYCRRSFTIAACLIEHIQVECCERPAKGSYKPKPGRDRSESPPPPSLSRSGSSSSKQDTPRTRTPDLPKTKPTTVLKPPTHGASAALNHSSPILTIKKEILNTPKPPQPPVQVYAPPPAPSLFSSSKGRPEADLSDSDPDDPSYNPDIEATSSSSSSRRSSRRVSSSVRRNLDSKRSKSFLSDGRSSHLSILCCTMCGTVFYDANKLRDHLANDLCTQMFLFTHLCGFPNCTFSTGHPNLFVSHFSRHHKGETFIPCWKCRRTFSVPACLVEHIQKECNPATGNVANATQSNKPPEPAGGSKSQDSSTSSKKSQPKVEPTPMFDSDDDFGLSSFDNPVNDSPPSSPEPPAATSSTPADIKPFRPADSVFEDIDSLDGSERIIIPTKYSAEKVADINGSKSVSATNSTVTPVSSLPKGVTVREILNSLRTQNLEDASSLIISCKLCDVLSHNEVDFQKHRQSIFCARRVAELEKMRLQSVTSPFVNQVIPSSSDPAVVPSKDEFNPQPVLLNVVKSEVTSLWGENSGTNNNKQNVLGENESATSETFVSSVLKDASVLPQNNSGTAAVSQSVTDLPQVVPYSLTSPLLVSTFIPHLSQPTAELTSQLPSQSASLISPVSILGPTPVIPSSLIVASPPASLNTPNHILGETSKTLQPVSSQISSVPGSGLISEAPSLTMVSPAVAQNTHLTTGKTSQNPVPRVVVSECGTSKNSTIPCEEIIAGTKNKSEVNKRKPQNARMTDIDNQIQVGDMLPQDVKVFKDWENWKQKVTALKPAKVMSSLLAEDKIQDFFKCMSLTCCFSTQDEMHFMMHITANHGLENLVCCYCFAVYEDKINDRQKYITHMLEEHQRLIFQCSGCLYRACSKDHLYTHYRSVHAGAAMTVITCQNPSNHGTETSVKIELHKTLNCSSSNCNFRTLVRTDFEHHWKMCHPDSTFFACCYCSYEATRLDMLMKHYNSHEIHDFECDYCPFGSEQASTVIDHICINHTNCKLQMLKRLPDTLPSEFSNSRVSPPLHAIVSSTTNNLLDTSLPDNSSPLPDISTEPSSDAATLNRSLVCESESSANSTVPYNAQEPNSLSVIVEGHPRPDVIVSPAVISLTSPSPVISSVNMPVMKTEVDCNPALPSTSFVLSSAIPAEIGIDSGDNRNLPVIRIKQEPITEPEYNIEDMITEEVEENSVETQPASKTFDISDLQRCLDDVQLTLHPETPPTIQTDVQVHNLEPLYQSLHDKVSAAVRSDIDGVKDIVYYACLFCSEKHETSQEAQCHARVVHKWTDLYKCTRDCDFTAPDQLVMSEHTKEKHPGFRVKYSRLAFKKIKIKGNSSNSVTDTSGAPPSLEAVKHRSEVSTRGKPSAETAVQGKSSAETTVQGIDRQGKPSSEFVVHGKSCSEIAVQGGGHTVNKDKTPPERETNDLQGSTIKRYKCKLCTFYVDEQLHLLFKHLLDVHKARPAFRCSVCQFHTDVVQKLRTHATTEHPNIEAEFFGLNYSQLEIPSTQTVSSVPAVEILSTKVNIVEPVAEQPPPSASSEPLSQDMQIIRKELTNELVSSFEKEVNLSTDLCTITTPRDNVQLDPESSATEITYYCVFCNCQTTDDTHMKSHLYTEMQYFKFLCLYCSYRNPFSTCVINHCRTSHPGKPANFKTKENTIIEKWVLDYIASQKMRARGINILYPSPRDGLCQKNHCNMCQASIPSGTVLRDHLYEHLQYKSHYCIICNMSFVTQRNLEIHLLADHSHEQYGSKHKAIKIIENWVEAIMMQNKLFSELSSCSPVSKPSSLISLRRHEPAVSPAKSNELPDITPQAPLPLTPKKPMVKPRKSLSVIAKKKKISPTKIPNAKESKLVVTEKTQSPPKKGKAKEINSLVVNTEELTKAPPKKGKPKEIILPVINTEQVPKAPPKKGKAKEINSPLEVPKAPPKKRKGKEINSPVLIAEEVPKAPPKKGEVKELISLVVNTEDVPRNTTSEEGLYESFQKPRGSRRTKSSKDTSHRRSIRKEVTENSKKRKYYDEVSVIDLDDVIVKKEALDAERTNITRGYASDASYSDASTFETDLSAKEIPHKRQKSHHISSRKSYSPGSFDAALESNHSAKKPRKREKGSFISPKPHADANTFETDDSPKDIPHKRLKETVVSSSKNAESTPSVMVEKPLIKKTARKSTTKGPRTEISKPSKPTSQIPYSSSTPKVPPIIIKTTARKSTTKPPMMKATARKQVQQRPKVKMTARKSVPRPPQEPKYPSRYGCVPAKPNFSSFYIRTRPPNSNLCVTLSGIYLADRFKREVRVLLEDCRTSIWTFV